VGTSEPRPVTRRLSEAVQSILGWTGMGRIYTRLRGLRGAIILMYHSVAEAESAAWIDPRDHLPPEVFEGHIRFLAACRRVISLSELTDACERGKDFPAGTVVITFDDGYLDNLNVAAPLLGRYGLPSTLFLPTGYVSRGEPQWVDRLYSAFRARTRHELSLPSSDAQRFDLRDGGQQHRAYRSAAGQLLSASPGVRRELLEDIERQLSPGIKAPRLTLNWDEVRELHRRFPSVEIGVHTREHVDLSAVGIEEARREILDAITDMRNELQHQPLHFSFPYSRSTPQVCRLVRDLGLRSAATDEAGLLIGRGSDPFDLKRIEAPASAGRFRLLTSGANPRLSLKRVIAGNKTRMGS
jgi:peptidoglycan/xylan/chitin deacetylase (PgdA/CDA1 family)